MTLVLASCPRPNSHKEHQLTMAKKIQVSGEGVWRIGVYLDGEERGRMGPIRWEREFPIGLRRRFDYRHACSALSTQGFHS